jgi:hypothetical protein
LIAPLQLNLVIVELVLFGVLVEFWEIKFFGSAVFAVPVFIFGIYDASSHKFEKLMLEKLVTWLGHASNNVSHSFVAVAAKSNFGKFADSFTLDKVIA